VSLRAAFFAIVAGLAAAAVLFYSSELRTGRLLNAATPTGAAPAYPAAPPTATTAPSPTTPPIPTATVVPLSPTAPRPTATPPPPARPSPPPPGAATAAPSEVSITLDELESVLRRSLESSGGPLRSPRLTFMPPDRIAMRAAVPVAIFQVPVEIEARLTVDDRGAVRVTTTRVDAVGATLPAGVTAELARRIDDEGSRAVAESLPRGARARRVVVEPSRVRIDLAS
jgi:hypothetical protein